MTTNREQAMSKVEELIGAVAVAASDLITAEAHARNASDAARSAANRHAEAKAALDRHVSGLQAAEIEFLKGNIRHGGHPVLTMCAANAVVKADPAGNRKLDKAKSTGRIDGMVALVMAIEAEVHASEGPSVYAPQTDVVLVPALTTPQQGTVTSSAATVNQTCTVGGLTNQPCGAASFAGGVATIGPLTPRLGRDIRVLLKGTWAGTAQVFTSPDGCVTLNPLTVGGQTWGSYSGNANEAVDTPTLGATGSETQPGYCLKATVTSGTLTYSLRQ